MRPPEDKRTQDVRGSGRGGGLSCSLRIHELFVAGGEGESEIPFWVFHRDHHEKLRYAKQNARSLYRPRACEELKNARVPGRYQVVGRLGFSQYFLMSLIRRSSREYIRDHTKLDPYVHSLLVCC